MNLFKKLFPVKIASKHDQLRDEIIDLDKRLRENAAKRIKLKDEAKVLQDRHDEVVNRLVKEIQLAPSGTIIKPSSIPSMEKFGKI